MMKEPDKTMSKLTGIVFTDQIDSAGHPWEGEREGPQEAPRGETMPHASNALLAVGDLLPSFTDWGGGAPPSDPPGLVTPSPEMGPPSMSEEEWLRELAARIGNMAPRFGAVDRQVRRELELAARMLNSYAVLWERRNNDIREDIKKRGDAL